MELSDLQAHTVSYIYPQAIFYYNVYRMNIYVFIQKKRYYEEVTECPQPLKHLMYKMGFSTMIHLGQFLFACFIF